MRERQQIVESIEQKQQWVLDYWIRGMAEQHEVKKMPVDILREVLESYGANFENLSEEGRKGLSMYSEKKRKMGMNEVWGEKLEGYDNWTNEYAEKYESENEKKLAKMVNTGHLVNEDRKASGDKNVGMKSFFRDITAYAAGSLNFDDLTLILGARVENGFIGAMTPEEKGDRKKIIIEWDREIDPTKGPLTKDPRPSRIYPGEFVADDKQEIRPASFPPEFPIEAFGWIKNN